MNNDRDRFNELLGVCLSGSGEEWNLAVDKYYAQDGSEQLDLPGVVEECRAAMRAEKLRKLEAAEEIRTNRARPESVLGNTEDKDQSSGKSLVGPQEPESRPEQDDL